MGRHMFFGGNTPEGFYSVFDNILFLDEAVKIIYMKGSSGSGKSTLMRKVSKAYEAMGYDVDYIHCSNNTTDLDGICIRALGIAMVDGTAPHVCDPSIPIGIDEIFNSADYINREYVTERAGALLKLQKAKKPYYAKAYNYLNGAYQIYKNNSYIYAQALNEGALNQAVDFEIQALSGISDKGRMGRNRKMFASAITPQGLTNYTDSLAEGKKVILLKGKDGSGTEKMLEAIRAFVNRKGYDTEGCYCSLNTDKLEHLIIEELGLCYSTVNAYHEIKAEGGRIVDFQDFLDKELIEKKQEELDLNSKIFEELLEMSMDMMNQQKEIHDEIEKIYIASMDFDGLNEASEKVIKSLLAYAK